MWPKKFIWQLYLSYMLIMGLPIILVSIFASRSVTGFYISLTKEDLKSRAYIIGSQIEDHMAHASLSGIDSLCKILAKKTKTRFTVIAPSGTVIGDSHQNPDSMDNHANRSEVILALSGAVGMSDRFSHTLQEDMIYVAIPLIVSGKIVGAVRTALPKTEVKGALSHLRDKVVWVFLLIAVFAAFVSYLVSRKVSLPVNNMKTVAQRFAAGDFSGKLAVSGCEETGQLAIALNEMASKLSGTITEIKAQRNQLDAIVSSMTEGVIAVDASERILMVNRAASALFGIDSQNAAGKWVGEALRNMDIQKFLAATLSSEKSAEREIVVLTTSIAPDDSGERYLQLHGAPLRSEAHTVTGALMVVNDITQIKRLDIIRKDFVANVSHELRTPLTSIKGFVETLLSGAMQDTAQAQRFLGILSNQVERLNTIVEDLLVLSKIERDEERDAIELSTVFVADVVGSAIESCSDKARKKNISIETSCAPGIIAKIERTLFEQALVNLLDNAINYSDSGKRIWVTVGFTKDDREIVFSVKDEGMGIAREHIDRLFERFYRVDKARSRKLGGTGLGLSIVKHIAHAHGGRVGVESELGRGSVFFIYLPRV